MNRQKASPRQIKKKKTTSNAPGKFVKRYCHLIFLLAYPALIFYYEFLFHASTAPKVFSMSFFYMLFFSITYGAVLYLISSIFRKTALNRKITTALVFLTAVPYLVEYYVFREFKVFYDVNTVTGGATDALGGFMGDIMKLIFCFDGLSKMALFLLPTFLYIKFGRKYIPACRSNIVVRLMAVIGGFVSYLLAILFISLNSVYAPSYNVEYNFQTAVNNFGLYTAVRLDVKKNMFGSGLDFDDSAAMSVGAIDPEDFKFGLQPKEVGTDGYVNESKNYGPRKGHIGNIQREYGYNVSDIDFEELSKKGTSTHKELDKAVLAMTPSKKNQYTGIFKGKNLIMISAEAFSAEVIDPELTPTLYRMATKGINFTDYYQPAGAGTTGGEYQNLFGMLPSAGGRSFKNTADHLNYYTMGSQLNRLGYYGKAFHNNSYTYYDRHKTHINLGYSDGYMGYGNGMEEYVKRAWPQSDLEMIAGTLPTYADKQPFNVYYMSVSGHSLYSQSTNAMSKKNWSRVQHLPYSEPVKAYFAANLEFEDAMTHLINELEARGIADDTVICISADHFPYGLDADGAYGNMPYLSELYGYNVLNIFQRDHSRLIIWSGCLEDYEPIVVDAPTFSLDIVPTLSNLFGTEFDSRLMPGRDVFSDAEPLVFTSGYDWKTQYGTYLSSRGSFVQSDPTVILPDGYVSSIKATVRNKIKFCKSVLDSDYYRHVFG